MRNKPSRGALAPLKGSDPLLCGSELRVGGTAARSGTLSAVRVIGSWGDRAPRGRLAARIKVGVFTTMDSKEAGHLAQTVALVFLEVRQMGSLLDSYSICVSREVLGQVNKSLTRVIKTESWL